MLLLENFTEKKNKNFNSIIVLADKEKYKNLLIYDAINKLLIKNNILAPILHKESYKKNYIEIQDFGHDTIFKIIKNNKNKKLIYFKMIIDTLDKMQSIKKKKIKNFQEKVYVIPKYKNETLIKEANLFCDWYVKKKLIKSKQVIFIKIYKQLIKNLTLNLKLKNDVFVHRDFHVSNLMLVNNQVGVIDSQDALIGNKAYDLASLIDDVRLPTSKLIKNKIFNLYLHNKKKIDKKKFQNDFEILSVLRNLKIIGIFTRLAYRDKKKDYIKLIPHAWYLINLRLNQNKIFSELKELLKKNFKGKIK